MSNQLLSSPEPRPPALSVYNVATAAVLTVTVGTDAALLTAL